jgi:hypothetical protein
MLEMWTERICIPGLAYHGTETEHFLVAPEGWRSDLKEGLFASTSKMRHQHSGRRLTLRTHHAKADGVEDAYPRLHRKSLDDEYGQGGRLSKRLFERTMVAQ